MPKDCHDTALSYLEHRARTVFEMKNHLLTKGFDEDEIHGEIEHLREIQYLDDARYCSEYIAYGIGKGRGPMRLQRELREKGVEAGLIREALEADLDRQTEKTAAVKEAKKLLKDSDSCPDEKTLAKIGRKLNTLGYHTDLIYDIIRNLK